MRWLARRWRRARRCGSAIASLSAASAKCWRALAAGKLNKQIAGELGIAEATVKFHRARLMDRMQAQTVAELMHLAARLDKSPTDKA